MPHGQLWTIVGGDSFTHPMLIIVFVQFRSEGQRKPRDDVEFPSTAECLVEFEIGAFRF